MLSNGNSVLPYFSNTPPSGESHMVLEFLTKVTEGRYKNIHPVPVSQNDRSASGIFLKALNRILKDRDKSSQERIIAKSREVIRLQAEHKDKTGFAVEQSVHTLAMLEPTVPVFYLCENVRDSEKVGRHPLPFSVNQLNPAGLISALQHEKLLPAMNIKNVSFFKIFAGIIKDRRARNSATHGQTWHCQNLIDHPPTQSIHSSVPVERRPFLLSLPGLNAEINLSGKETSGDEPAAVKQTAAAERFKSKWANIGKPRDGGKGQG